MTRSGPGEPRTTPASGPRAAATSPDRPALPTATADLPELESSYHRTLDRALDQLGLRPTPGARAAIDTQARMLVAWAGAINLTALRTPEQIALEHVADSLSAIPILRQLDRDARGRPSGAPRSLLDIGSGAGYPGLPLALALPVSRVALVESIGKKATFLDVAGRAAVDAMRAAGEEAPAFSALGRRSESLAGDPAHRERWDLVVARAVGALAEVAELALPLLRVGGRLAAWKRDDGGDSLRREIEAARPMLAAAGAEPQSLRVGAVTIDGLGDHRIITVMKSRRTPSRYPRSPADRNRALLRCG